MQAPRVYVPKVQREKKLFHFFGIFVHLNKTDNEPLIGFSEQYVDTHNAHNPRAQ